MVRSGVRRLEPRDAAAYWHLRLEALEREPMAFGMAAEEHRATTVEAAEARLRGMSGDTFVLGGFEAGELVATAMFSRSTNVKERHKGHVYGVYVRQANRGRGWGSGLMRELIDRATEIEDLEQILLAVSAVQEPALRLYRKLGFTVYGVEPRALKIAAVFVDEVLMLLRVKGPPLL